MLRLTTFVVSLGLVVAHICVYDPPQRGIAPNGGPGDHNCYRRTPYCGGIPVAEPRRTYIAGDVAVVRFQQNLNHWHTAKPGFFDVAIAHTRHPSEDDFVVLRVFDDYPTHDMVYQTNFTVEVRLPHIPCEHCILRFRYVSYNPQEVDPKNNTDAIFYNCADVRVIAAPAGHIPSAFSESGPQRQVAGAKDMSCSTPQQWIADAVEMRSPGVVQHRIYYDAVAKMVRWDRYGDLHGHGVENLTLITPYLGKPEVEYKYRGDLNTCSLTGPDAWYDWAYGAQFNQVFRREFTLPEGGQAAEWVSKDGRVTFVAKVLSNGECAPYAQHHEGSAMVFTSVKAGAPDPSVFTIPSVCPKQ